VPPKWIGEDAPDGMEWLNMCKGDEIGIGEGVLWGDGKALHGARTNDDVGVGTGTWAGTEKVVGEGDNIGDSVGDVTNEILFEAWEAVDGIMNTGAVCV